jgi:hypothetical protein
MTARNFFAKFNGLEMFGSFSFERSFRSGGKGIIRYGRQNDIAI